MATESPKKGMNAWPIRSILIMIPAGREASVKLCRHCAWRDENPEFILHQPAHTVQDLAHMARGGQRRCWTAEYVGTLDRAVS